MLGSGRPIVLLHGLGGSGAYWGGAFDALAAGGRLLVPDLAGFGGSPAAPSSTADAHAHSVLAALAALAPGQPALVAGHSAGGLIALRMGALAPDAVAAVVALAPPLFASRESARRHFAEVGWLERWILDERPPARLLQGWAEGASRATAGWLGILARPDLPPRVARDGFLTRSHAYRQMVQDILLAGGAEELLAGCRAPVTILAGDVDRATDQALLRGLAERHPGLRVSIVPGGDHHLPLLAPEQCLRAIEDALSEVLPGGDM